MAQTKDLIKEKLGIAEVVGTYIKLEKAGINFKARCPFHNEKTPSFFVSPSRGGYFCFGCGEKGDIFSFVEKIEGVDFKGALKILAEKAGVEIRYEAPESKSEKELLHVVLEDATEYFEKALLEKKDALHYLKERGLEEKTINSFRLGYASLEWRELLSYLRKKGYRDDVIAKAGLIKKSDEESGKDYYDRFRGRIMFPITDTSGRVIAFSGRIFEKPEKGEEPAKYINSPETPLVIKSKVLYGFDKAREGVRKWGFVVLVEGQMDLLMSHQAGYGNTVALSGTALTPEHVALLLRLSSKIVLALDADEAGLRASGKSAALTLSRGMDVKVARMKEGKDPADLVKTDKDLWRQAIKEATHIIDFYLEVLKEMKLGERSFRKKVSEQVIPYVARVESPIDRAHFIGRVAMALHLPESSILEEVLTVDISKVESETNIPYSEKEMNSSKNIQELLQDRLFGLLITETNLGSNKLNKEGLRRELEDILGGNDFEKCLENATLSADVLFEAEETYSRNEELESEVERLLLNLKHHRLKTTLQKLTQEIKEKELAEDTKGVAETLHSYHQKSKELSEIDSLLKK